MRILNKRQLILTAAAASLPVAVLLAACSEPLGIKTEESARGNHGPGSAQASVPDISGEWSFTRENFIHLTEFAAVVFFGLEPEGPRTTLRCSAEGTMTIVQSGGTFTGQLTQFSECVTSGGQLLAGIVENNPLTNGTIRGRSIAFTLGADPGLDCPVQGVISAGNGAAVAMRGTWQCVEPGHPRSAFEGFPPPRLGPNRAHWEATRAP